MKKISYIHLSKISTHQRNIKRGPTKTSLNCSHFETLSTNCVQILLSFLEPKEQVKTFTINYKFRSAFAEMNSFDYTYFNAFKSLFHFYFKIEKLSIKNSPYLNIYLNTNILNIPLENFTSLNLPAENEIAIRNIAFQYFLLYRTMRTKNNKIYISIIPHDEFCIQTYIHFFKTYKNISQIKCTLYIGNNFSLTNKLNDMIKLYTLIPELYNIETNYTKQCLHLIQQEIFKQNINCMHLNVFSTDNNDINKAVEYFKQNNNCLKGIISRNQKVLCEYNKESITSIISGAPFEIADITPILTNLTEIKFNYANNTFDRYFNDNLFTDVSNTIKCIGGFVIEDEDDCDNLVAFINSKLPRVNTLYNITFENDDNYDLMPEELFEYLCSNLKNSEIEQLVFWGLQFQKRHNYSYCVNHLPKIRKLWEDYDESSWYEHRFEIKDVFACNTDNQLVNEDFQALIKVIGNYLKGKEEGEKYIDIKLFCDDITLGKFCDYCAYIKNDWVIDSIGSIDYEVNVNDGDIEEYPGLKHLNWFEIKRNNEMLFKCIKNVKVDVVSVNNSTLLKDDVIELMKSLKPYCVIFRKALNDDLKEIEIVKSIGNCVQIVVLNNKKECDKVKECYKELNFMVIANNINMNY